MARKESQIKPKKILIIPEDKVSFPSYLELLMPELFYQPYGKNKYKGKGKNPYIVEIWHCGHNDPLTIVKKANEKSEDYEKVYCVFDKDGHQEYNKAINCRTANNVERIVSVPCYEFWLVLHLKNTSSPYRNGDEVKKELRDLLRKRLSKSKFEYKKSKMENKVFTSLNEGLQEAKSRAKKIKKDNYNTNCDNPSTTIYKLIEDLENYQE